MNCPTCGQQAAYIQGVRWFCDRCDRPVSAASTEPRHNANPPDPLSRTIRGLRTLLRDQGRLIAQLEALLAEVDTAEEEA
jgi:predicted amidophosphoribosyltransferase